MKVLFIIYFVLIITLPGYFIPPGTLLKGKVYDEDRNPVKNLTIRFSNIGTVITTNSGEFVIELPDGIFTAEIELADNKLSIMYPVDHKISIPSDPAYISKVVIAKKKTGSESTSELAKKYLKLESLMKDIGLSQEKLTSMIGEYIKKESEEKSVDEDKLKQAVYSEKKNERFSVISSAMSEYIVKANDFSLVFRNASRFNFSKHEALVELVKAVEGYNLSFNNLNNNKFAYPGDVSLFWENPELADSLYKTILFAIDNLHKPYILSLNKEITEINMLSDPDFAGDNPEEKKKELVKIIEEHLNNLDAGMIILESKANDLLSSLKNNM